MSGKLLDARYVEHEHTAVHLARLCYPLGVALEVAQPVTALKLLQAVYAARSEMAELVSPLLEKPPARKKKRALAAARCARSILLRLADEETAHASRAAAAAEAAQRLIELLREDR
ncbi:MAG TPA: hypothetical protein VF021_12220 [Longimicrobiales bacterium]